jgi:hypothetical protein
MDSALERGGRYCGAGMGCPGRAHDRKCCLVTTAALQLNQRHKQHKESASRMFLKWVTVNLPSTYATVSRRRVEHDPDKVFVQNATALWEQRFPVFPIFFSPQWPLAAYDEDVAFAYSSSLGSFRKWDRRRKVVKFAHESCVCTNPRLPPSLNLSTHLRIFVCVPLRCHMPFKGATVHKRPY